MIEYGIRTAAGRVIVGPDWRCEGDVLASMHDHELPVAADHGDLVVRTDGGEWAEVTR